MFGCVKGTIPVGHVQHPQGLVDNPVLQRRGLRTKKTGACAKKVEQDDGLAEVKNMLVGAAELEVELEALAASFFVDSIEKLWFGVMASHSKIEVGSFLSLTSYSDIQIYVSCVP
mmetsp:Transcript_37081/g.75252  ORF Transcript_37081/g.75252 Transcript_37081/m.75252 type:complete len:115 (+) Transcript_37081:1024-1368(+)